MRLLTVRGRPSVRRQLIVGNVITLAVAFLVVGLLLRATVRARLLASVDRDLAVRMEMLSRPGPPPGGPGPGRMNGQGPRMGFGGGLRRGLGPPPALPPPPGDAMGQGMVFRPRILHPSGMVIAPPDAPGPWDREALSRAEAGGSVFTTVRVSGVDVRVLSRAYTPSGEALRVYQVPYPLADVQRAVRDLDRSLMVGAPLVLLFAAWAGFALTNRVLRAIRRITLAAGEIGADDLSARLPAAGEDEFARLSVAFNAMLGRLERAFADKERLVERLERLVEQERRFIADASHELRTPLTVIKANTSLALADPSAPEAWQSPMQDIDRAADAAASLVRDLLLLARSDAGQLGRGAVTFPLRDLLGGVIASYEGRPGARIHYEPPHPAICVRGNEDELARVFNNLLANARRCTPNDGAITVATTADGAHITTTVRDTGHGVAPEHLPHLTERFYRVDAARSRHAGGSGLGLAICKDIVAAHGGTLKFDSAPGEGMGVEVSLPTAPSHSAPDAGCAPVDT